MINSEIKTVGKFAATFGGITIAGAEIMSGVSFAQTNPQTTNEGVDCASPSPAPSLVIESPSPMPSFEAVKPSPSGNIDVFIPSPSPAPYESPLITTASSIEDDNSQGEWSYEGKDIKEIIAAWNDGTIKIEKSDRWRTSQGYIETFGNQGLKDPVKEVGSGVYNYRAVLLGSEVVDNQVEFVAGFEGKILNDCINDYESSFNRERFTALIKVSYGLNSPAEISEMSSSDGEPITILGEKIMNEHTTAKDVYKVIKNRVGSKIVFISEFAFIRPWVGLKNPSFHAGRKEQGPYAKSFYNFTWEAWNGKSVEDLKKTPNINKAPGSINSDKLPSTIFMFIDKK